MHQTKALYNALRMGDHKGAKVPPWAIEDLRAQTFEQLWKRLNQLEINLNQKTFIQFAEGSDTPEDLTEILVDEDKDPTYYDQVYLIVFELWRRLFPEKASLSIFADEFDHQIDLYVKDEIETDEQIQDALAQLSEILDEHIDAGMKPKEAFAAVTEYCASDLENFFYLYISDLLDQENPSYAEELFEEFSPFFPKHTTFDFIKARLTSFSDQHEANRQIETILSKKLELNFLFDILRVLVISGDRLPFQKTIKQILLQLKSEEDFIDLLELTADYFSRLDLDAKEQAILKIRQNRKESKATLKPTDPDLAKFKEVVSD
jgi:hypothetical protein